MNSNHLFSIAGHVVGICFSPSDINDISLLPSFAPFRWTSAETVKPLLTLCVDDTLQPEKERTLLRNFDTGNGNTLVYQLPDKGYQFIIRDTKDRDCCLLIANADFSECRCALNGDVTMRQFGLNNALMLCYAFAGSHYQTLLIHASCVAYNGCGYPFIAKSGTGKSTHSSLWLQHIEGTELMNDDNPVIRIIDGTPYIYGSPWSGKTPCYRNIVRPLGAIVNISRASANSIEQLGPVQTFAALLPACSSMMWDSVINDNLCNSLTTIISTTPIYTLHCLPDEAAARLCQSTIAP
jgi:hypothetical protein